MLRLLISPWVFSVWELGGILWPHFPPSITRQWLGQHHALSSCPHRPELSVPFWTNPLSPCGSVAGVLWRLYLPSGLVWVLTYPQVWYLSVIRKFTVCPSWAWGRETWNQGSSIGPLHLPGLSLKRVFTSRSPVLRAGMEGAELGGVGRWCKE